MEQTQNLKKSIKSAQEMHGVTRTMKTLSAININHYQKALTSLRDYRENINLALHIVLLNDPALINIWPRNRKKTTQGIIVLGSEQGLVGQFNQGLLEYLEKQNSDKEMGPGKYMTLGYKIGGLLENRGFQVDEQYPMARNLDSITPLLVQILKDIIKWIEEENIKIIKVYYNQYKGQSSYEPDSLEIYPPGRQTAMDLQNKIWSGPCIPMNVAPPTVSVKKIIQEYIFIGLYQAIIESLVSENESRLAVMQQSEKNIKEKIQELTADYNRSRQNAITSELLDIISGYQSINKP